MTPTPIRLLLIEDNPGDARLVCELLTRHAPGEFAVTMVERLADALRRAGTEPFDVALCDLGLPDSSELATLQAMATHSPALPLVVLTGLDEHDIGRKAIELGAQDYLVKGEAGGEVIARTLRHAIERKRLEIQLHQANQKLADMNKSLEEKVIEKSAALTQEIKEHAQLQTRLESERRAGAEKLQRTYLRTIEAIALALEKRSVNTSGG